MAKISRRTVISVTFTAEQLAQLLQAVEHGMAIHPVDAELIAKAIRDAVASKQKEAA